MIKENKIKLILTSIVIILPMIAGLLLWSQLPDKIPTHWNAEGVVNGWSSKAFAVFFLPVLMLVFHWLCVLGSSLDPKRKNYSGKLWGFVLWICPIISVLMYVLVYGTALGMEFKVDKIMLMLMGVMFLFVGNYLPKCKQNYTMGIKLPWTLNDEENWNYTHRLGGKVWVISGVLVILCMFLPSKMMVIAIMVILFAAIIVPTVCSYMFYRKKNKR